jgi:hypothetical protein
VTLTPFLCVAVLFVIFGRKFTGGAILLSAAVLAGSLLYVVGWNPSARAVETAPRPQPTICMVARADRLPEWQVFPPCP